MTKEKGQKKKQISINKIFKIFYYAAPLIGLLYGVYYLQSNRNNNEVTISKERLETVIIDIVEDLDKTECIDEKILKSEVNKIVSRMN